MIRLTRELREQMTRHAGACLPEEACGLVGGVEGEARVVLAVANQLHSPVRFRMDPTEQLRAFQALESAGLELIAIFHSHPNGPPTPSPTDVAEYDYPGVLALILTPGDTGWEVRAFEMLPDGFQETSVGLWDELAGENLPAG